jgi:hypothetical protein
MDVSRHKSPFVFEQSELPVVMLFPAADKRPLEFSGALRVDALARFDEENASAQPTEARASRKEDPREL